MTAEATRPLPARDDIAAAADLLFRMGASFDQYTAQMRRAFAINAHERLALSILWSRGPQTMSDLGMGIPLSRAAVTTLVDRLEAAGLVRRGHDGSDRRRTVVTITDEALERMHPVIMPWGAAVQGLLETRTDDEWRAISTFLTDFRDLNDEQAGHLSRLDDTEIQAMAVASEGLGKDRP